MLCDWLQDQGHDSDTALLAEMPHVHEEVGRFILKHRPDVVIYDVGMPYASSWDLLEVIRSAPALESQPFGITTPNKRKLELAVGPTSAVEIGGREADLRRHHETRFPALPLSPRRDDAAAAVYRSNPQT